MLVIAEGIAWLRRTVLPGLLAMGLAAAAILDLAGGLINVGQNVLYNASAGPYSKPLGTHFLQYDHFTHAYVSFVVAFACWVLLAQPHAADGGIPAGIWYVISSGSAPPGLLSAGLPSLRHD